jgi:hypothetical protein
MDPYLSPNLVPQRRHYREYNVQTFQPVFTPCRKQVPNYMKHTNEFLSRPKGIRQIDRGYTTIDLSIPDEEESNLTASPHHSKKHFPLHLLPSYQKGEETYRKLLKSVDGVRPNTSSVPISDDCQSSSRLIPRLQQKILAKKSEDFRIRCEYAKKSLIEGSEFRAKMRESNRNLANQWATWNEESPFE